MTILGDTLEFRCSARLMRGVLVYVAPDAGEDAATVKVRFLNGANHPRALAESGWCSTEEHDRFWSVPKQAAALPTRHLVRVTGIKLGGKWKRWTADVWEALRVEDEYGGELAVPVAVAP